MSLGTTTRSLTKTAKKRFPGASDADIRQFVRLQVDTALDNPSRSVKDEDLDKLTDSAFSKAVEAGEDWAVGLKNSVRDSVVKPLVEKAREKGVDPVPVIVMQTDLSETEAVAMIESLDADAAADGNAIASELEAETETDGENSDAAPTALATAAY